MSASNCPPFYDFECEFGDYSTIEYNDDQEQDRAVEVEQRYKTGCFANRFSKRPELKEN